MEYKNTLFLFVYKEISRIMFNLHCIVNMCSAECVWNYSILK